MAETGRILHHLKNNIQEPYNTVLFVGFQAPNTLGRKLADGEKRIKIFGEQYDVKARIEKIDGLSAHADKNEMLTWLGSWKKPPAKTFVVHGEPEAAEAFAATLREHGHPDVTVPARGDSAKV